MWGGGGDISSMNFSLSWLLLCSRLTQLMGHVFNLAGTGVGSVPQVGTGSTLLPYWAEGSHGMNVEPNGYQFECLKKD